MKKIVLLQMVLILIISLVGCNKSGDSKADGEIVVTESKWHDQGSSEEEKVFDDIEKGDVLSDTSFGTLTVKKVIV